MKDRLPKFAKPMMEVARVPVRFNVLAKFLVQAALVAALSVFAWPHALQADERDALPEVKSLRVGFANHYKLGCWTPVQIERSGVLGGDSGASGRLDVQAPDSDGVPVWFIGPRVIWTAGMTDLAYTRIGRGDRPLQIRLTKLGNTDEQPPELLRILPALDPPVAVPTTSEFIVEVENSIGLQERYKSGEADEARRTSVVLVGAKEQLPDRWYGYEGVDLLVLAGSGALESVSQNAAALNAIEQWVRQGGKLLISVGSGAGALFAKGAALERFAPGEFEEEVGFPNAGYGAIEIFAAGGEEPRRMDARQARVPQWRNVPAERIDLSYGSGPARLPIVVRSPLGFGEVIFVGLDLHQTPFIDWSGRDKFLDKIIHPEAAAKSRMQEIRNPGKRLGFVDLSGQLRGALDQFAGVETTPFWVVALAAFGFIALLFPVSYWIVTRWLKQQWIAWLILPLAVATVCWGAWALANATKGNQVRANQVDLVDIELPAGTVRGTTWFNVFSPTNELYNFQVHPKFAGMLEPNATNSQPNALLSWFGAPGAGLGGMSAAAAAQPLFDEPYTIDAERGTIEGAPISVWSSKSFVARWSARGGGLEHNLTAAPLTRNGEELRLYGTIENQLGVPLEECVVFYGNAVYTIGKLDAQPVTVDKLDVQAARHFLSKRPRQVIKDETPPYDFAGFNVPRILEMMMFHETAGGANYTGLLNRYQQFVDLSGQLELGKAILVGWGPSGAKTQLNDATLDEIPESRHDTVYRFVLPVQVLSALGAN